MCPKQSSIVEFLFYNLLAGSHLSKPFIALNDIAQICRIILTCIITYFLQIKLNAFSFLSMVVNTDPVWVTIDQHTPCVGVCYSANVSVLHASSLLHRKTQWYLYLKETLGAFTIQYNIFATQYMQHRNKCWE